MNLTKKVFFLLLAVPVLAAAAEIVSTRQNLMTAYNQEMNAKLRYEAFARRADTEGLPGAAGVFRAIAFSESVHAANHAKAIEGLGGRAVESIILYEVKDTGSNLRESLKLENEEAGATYPSYVAQAIAEGDELAVRSLKGALASEEGHAALFTKLIRDAASLKNRLVVLVCRTCGYTTDDQTIKKCPYCGHPRKEFAARL